MVILKLEKDQYESIIEGLYCLLDQIDNTLQENKLLATINAIETQYESHSPNPTENTD